MNAVINRGPISRIVSGMGPEGPFVIFRVGNVPCRATSGLSLMIVAGRGWPGHNVEVHGTLDEKTIAVEKLLLID